MSSPDLGVDLRERGGGAGVACAYVVGLVTGGRFPRSGGVEGGDSGWWGDPAGAKNAGLGGVQRGGVDGGAGAAGEGDGVDAAEFGGDAAPGHGGAAFGDPDEQQ